MPLDQFGWATSPPPPDPPTTLWPGRTRNELLVDTWGVMLADPQGNLIGLPNTAGPPLARMLYAQRRETRNL